MNSRSAQRNEGSDSGRANASSYVERAPNNERFTGTSKSVRGGPPISNKAKQSRYEGPLRKGPSLVDRQIRGWQRHPDDIKLSRKEAEMMLYTFFLGLAIPTENTNPVVLSVMVGMMWSQRSIIDGWTLKARCESEVRHSGIHCVTSVPYADQDGGATVDTETGELLKRSVMRAIDQDHPNFRSARDALATPTIPSDVGEVDAADEESSQSITSSGMPALLYPPDIVGDW